MTNDLKKHFLASIEEEMLGLWDKDDTFRKTLKLREKGPLFNFYDGPPFANGIPHYGHLEQITIKDTITRYKTMQGYYVPRRVGWDTHGLPIEYAIEKKHEFKSKKDIEKYGIDKFNQECRESVYLYKDIWEKMFRRVGRWADYTKTYSTLDQDYIESVWWVFKTLFDKGLVYKDFRCSPYCPRCATPLSNFELNQGYQDNIKDPSLFVKFKLKDEDAFMLGWTTTPWSLPGNAAIAVKPEAKYVYVKLVDDDQKEETLVLARDRLESLNVDSYEIIKECHGSDLVGKSYEPLFKLKDLDKFSNSEALYKVWGAEFVSITDGSGVLHVAPAFGDDDLLLSRQHNLPVLLTIDEGGHVKTDMGLDESFAGKFFKQADNLIIEYLVNKDMVYAAGYIKHTYPFCWRCDTPLLYYATDSWLIKVTQIKDQLIANNQQINWTPASIKNGRFGKWLEQVRDWAVSRNRFWGAPLPIWVTEDGELVVIGSVEELKKRAVNPAIIKDLHRPFIDKVVVKSDSGKLAHRINEVFDCWFESGSMPYGQDHHPFENESTWNKRFPADFIAEAVDQTRGWFYTLTVLATALYDKPAFKNAISSGWIVAADGEKLSKRKKNYAAMDDVFDQFGVDTLRFFITSSPLMNGEDTRFSVDFLRDVQRKIFMTLQNTYSFYKMYADVDKFQPNKEFKQPDSHNLLDQWIISRVNQTVSEVTKALDRYRLDKATRPIVDLIDDLSNWFVRRSRRRFWKSQDDQDKKQAYQTLHYAILVTCQLIAPFSPFLGDYIWRELTKNTNLPDSVHLSDWPKNNKVDHDLLTRMHFAREVINQGLSHRAEQGVKVRQPLKLITIYDKENLLKKDREFFDSLIAEELNLKEVIYTTNELTNGQIVGLDFKLTQDLVEEGLVREVVRYVQSLRKESELKVDDRINLNLKSNSKELNSAVKNYEQTIKTETLAVTINVNSKQYKSRESVKVEGFDLEIELERLAK